MRGLSEAELSSALSGRAVIDVADMQRHVLLRGWGKAGASDPTVQLFFQTVSRWTQADLSALLLFVTGAARLPAGGFSALSPPFTLQRAVDANNLPSASTCHSLLKLPPYATLGDMNAKLRTSVGEGSIGFSFA